MWKAPIYRAAYKKRYGTRCFLKGTKYPVCTDGKIDCNGVRAAAYYIRLNNVKSLKRKIGTLKKYCQKLKKTKHRR